MDPELLTWFPWFPAKGKKPLGGKKPLQGQGAETLPGGGGMRGADPRIPGMALRRTGSKPALWDTHRDILQGGIDDLVVVWKAVKLEGVEVEEDMVAELDTVNVGVRLQTSACKERQKAVEKRA